MTTIPLDRFLRYDELTEVLHALAADHPDLVAISSIGRSHEGRDIWLATVTDASSGPAHEKPAMWVDANIHATELTASVAALALLRHLVSNGDDPAVREALRTRTFYVVPRVNPDGAELALADRPRYLRSSVRPWPWSDRWRQPGLHKSDVDGDGRILTMRIPDPLGAWMPHPDEPRLMIPVPADGITDAPRYRLLDEGELEGYDGYVVPLPRPPEGLDLNRNFPAGWGTNIPGAGDHPGSEPEVRALIEAITARPNICGTNAYHTFGGVLLRPSSTTADSNLPPDDVWTWKQLGTRCTELTGYPVHSVFEDFTWDPKHTMAGAADDWSYEHLGVFSWTTEFWDVIHAATGERAPTSVWYLAVDPEIELKVLRWLDEHHPGSYVDWYPYEHPQLGPIELGGWDNMRSWNNPPRARLETEVAGHPEFAVFQALTSPRLVIEQCHAESLGDGLWRVRAGIANAGWLSTTVTDRAARESIVRPVAADLLDADGSPVPVIGGGGNRLLLGQLHGTLLARFSGLSDGTPHRAAATWIVRGDPGDELTVVAHHQRAGTVRASVTLA